MKCPKCRNRQLQVAIAFTGRVACAFSSDEEFELLDNVLLDSEWDDEAGCECIRCGWAGRVAQARSTVAPPSHRRGADTPGGPLVAEPPDRNPLTADDITQIQTALDAGYCHPIWKRSLRRLIAEVERQKALLEAINRLSHHERGMPGDAVTQDTVIG